MFQSVIPPTHQFGDAWTIHWHLLTYFSPFLKRKCPVRWFCFLHGLLECDRRYATCFWKSEGQIKPYLRLYELKKDSVDLLVLLSFWSKTTWRWSKCVWFFSRKKNANSGFFHHPLCAPKHGNRSRVQMGRSSDNVCKSVTWSAVTDTP